MEEQFKVYKDNSSSLILPRIQYLCKMFNDGNVRDYIFELTTNTEVEYNASFMTFLGKDWYKYPLNVHNIVRKMYIPKLSKKVIHPLRMRIGGLYEIHDIRHSGTYNRGIYRLKDINDCVYYFSRIKGNTTIFQHDILSEDTQMCKDRRFFEIDINREVIDQW